MPAPDAAARQQLEAVWPDSELARLRIQSGAAEEVIRVAVVGSAGDSGRLQLELRGRRQFSIPSGRLGFAG